MRVFNLVALSLVFLIGGGSVNVQAQSLCGERTQVLKHLADGYGESAVGMGMAANGAVLEVMASDAGSWTILVTLPSGATCIVATGENWELLLRKTLERGS